MEPKNNSRPSHINQGRWGLNFVRFKTLGDLVRFAALSHAHFIYHKFIGGKDIYFVHILGLVEGMVYYIEQDKAIKERYFVYHPLRDEVAFTDKMEVTPTRTILPFLELESDTLFYRYQMK